MGSSLFHFLLVGCNLRICRHISRSCAHRPALLLYFSRRRRGHCRCRHAAEEKIPGRTPDRRYQRVKNPSTWNRQSHEIITSYLPCLNSRAGTPLPHFSRQDDTVPLGIPAGPCPFRQCFILERCRGTSTLPAF